jgi:hypothetical protein
VVPVRSWRHTTPKRFAREHGYGLWSGCETDAEGDTNELSGDQGSGGNAREQPAPEPVPTQVIIVDPSSALGCDPSYPDPGVCIPPLPPDLDCGQIGARRFTVLPPDPHGFAGDSDGVGCESE